MTTQSNIADVTTHAAELIAQNQAAAEAQIALMTAVQHQNNEVAQMQARMQAENNANTSMIESVKKQGEWMK